jgi:hypothetical protein
VIDSPDQLAEGLTRAIATHAATYKPVQEELFSYSFDLTETPSSVRAANVVIALCQQWSTAR